MNRQTLADVLQDTNQTGSYTLATVLEGAEAGSQLLLRDGDALWQTQSAGLLQRQLAALQDCTATGFLTLDGQRVFAERFGAVPQLVVCGGGHVAAALVKQAKLLGLPVLAIDDREEFAQQLRAAGADTVLCAPFAQALQNVPGGAETYFAVLTRSHAFDLDCLTLILQKPAAYVGMMGSRGRAALVRRQLLETGLDSQRVESLCAPIGLAIGAQTAAEIALSILAQIVQVKNGRPQTEGYPIALLDAMVQAENARTPAVLATIVARHGSTPRDVGAKMLILPDGSTVGSVGGGIMEHYTVQAARKMLAQAATQPAAIRRQVALCEAVYEGETTVEGLRAVRIETLEQAQSVWAQSAVPVLVDPEGACIARAKPEVVVDAILAKRNLGTHRDMAPLTIALGPGFVAGQDVDVVVETKRGHRLGRIIREGSAIPNTGIPGVIGGYGAERVIHAQAAGVFMNVRKIGDLVEKGETIATIRTPEGAEIPVTAQIPGILRGLLRSGYPVTPGFKIADIDPRREELSNCFLISDKSRCIAGSVLELVCAQVWQ